MKAAAIGLGLMSCLVLFSCSDDDGTETPGGSKDPPNQTLIDSCVRYCGLMEAFEHACQLGELYYHGVVVGPDTPEEAPLSTDRECIDSCTKLSPRALCWQDSVAQMDCSVEAVWMCDDDGRLSTDDCVGVGGIELCEGQYARPEAWQQSDEWTAACQRYCGLAEALVDDCNPGDTRIRGVPLGSEPPDEPPISNDPACMQSCLLPNSRWRCAEELIARQNCFADALWVCELRDSWSTDECEAEDKGSLELCQ